MFDFIRHHTKIMMGLLFLLIIPSFVLFGIDGYNQSGDKGAAVAQVGGQGITQAEWDFAHKNEVERLRASRPNLDVKLLDSPEMRYASLERLVQEKVLAQAAEQSKLSTSDARLTRELQQVPAISSLIGADGKLDRERYRQLVAAQGLTPEGFEARVRRDLSVRQVQEAVTASGFAAAALADVALNAFFEKREVQVASFKPSDFAGKVAPTDAELEAFYKANQALFQAPEAASIEYLVLDLESIKKTITLNESDVKSYYEQNALRLSGDEERRASHILINAAKEASPAEHQKAKARAEELLQSLRKAPDSFAEVAKKNSQDTGSAVSGGDLDFFKRGGMVKPFSDAAFALKKGDISDVVQSEYGYHIIRLTDIKAPKQRSFDELRPSIEADLKTQQAQRKFAESAEAFTNGVYEQSDSLKPVADKLKLEVRTATGLARNPAPGATGVLANSKFLAVIFGPDAIEKKRNTEAVETAPSQLVSGRITQYTPAKTLAFADVRANVRERVVAARANELAKKDGADKLVAWKANPAAASLPAAVVVSRDRPQNLPQPVLTAALRADSSVLPAFVGIDLGEQGYAVVKVNKLVPRDAPTADTAKQDRAQYTQWWTAAEGQAYYALLKDRFKVQMKVPRPALLNADSPAVAVQ
ncbi:SurA N-terminal domain-containing protein [Rhodoferax sp.]|uniref:SurA N-terminal domain-containing protein n=1 Tax=Rhodoferax sp. TaxID=50421 RepID=UPI00274589B1|nr:SurA N-terminal domain-containing protein [Rhodoferax sp.]